MSKIGVFFNYINSMDRRKIMSHIMPEADPWDTATCSIMYVRMLGRLMPFL